MLAPRSRGPWNQKEEQFQEPCGRLMAKTPKGVWRVPEPFKPEVPPEISRLRTKDGRANTNLVGGRGNWGWH